ncbi:hypothetical protein ACW9YQ_32980 (plasmid) [Paraburkholderia strydomiana]|uniref:hypothetical protein n=1 Tax=Paraburkholderia sp. 22098 TaxID=3453874 RepID=UPI003F845B57
MSAATDPLTSPYRIVYRVAGGRIVGPGNLDAALLSPPACSGRIFFAHGLMHAFYARILSGPSE